MKIEIVSREIIKPSSPTPDHLKIFKLCFLDQFQRPVYMPQVFFYPKNSVFVTDEEKRQRLKQSLSRALTRFYPLAGRIQNNFTIDCNDYGAHFLEARISHSLSSFLQPPDLEALKLFLPIEIESPKAATLPLLVQLNFFECGGVAVAICLSHRFGDAVTRNIFIRDWAAMAVGLDEHPLPDLDFDASASFFPPREIPVLPFGLAFKPCNRIVPKRFVFSGTKIEALKSDAISPLVQRPSRTEAVTALIWRCAMAARRSTAGVSKPSMMVQFANMRKRVVEPHFLENSMGNHVLYYISETEEMSEKTELRDLVAQLRKGIAEFDENVAKRLIGGDDDSIELIEQHRKQGRERMSGDGVDAYFCTSLCNFGFYEIDFGWGKPIWIGIFGSSQSNFVKLMDTREDGVEAWVSLSEEEMPIFECHPQLLSFASLNPNVL